MVILTVDDSNIFYDPVLYLNVYLVKLFNYLQISFIYKDYYCTKFENDSPNIVKFDNNVCFCMCA